MSDFNFSLEEIKSFIETEIPDTEKGELLELLKDTAADETNLDSIGEKFFAEHSFHTMPVEMEVMGDAPTGRIGSQIQIGWQEVKKALYKLLCTEKQIKHIATFKDFVSAIIPIIASRLSVNPQDITLLVTASVIFALSNGIINFCENNKCILD